MNAQISIRLFEEPDKEPLWRIINSVISGGETYVFEPDSSREKMLNYWLAKEKRVYVACLGNELMATFTIKPNMPDRGSHVANASYMVDPLHSGKGVGELIGMYSLEEAKRLGYQAMQFNIVIKSNERAVNLWKRIGFEIIGEVPNAFNHPRFGMTNAYIMYKAL